MKSEEFVDEGLGSWIKGSLARNALLGQDAYIKQLRQDDFNSKVKSFAQTLKIAFDNALERNEILESINLNSVKNYTQFNKIFETLLNETPISVRDWVLDQINRRTSVYDKTPEEEVSLKNLADEFQVVWQTTRKFPVEVAEKLGAWVYDIGNIQTRDVRRNVLRSGSGSDIAAKKLGISSAQFPTIIQWTDICNDLDAKGITTKTGTKWIDSSGKPIDLEFQDDNLRKFKFDFASNTWKNLSNGQDVSSQDAPVLNAMFVKKINDLLKTSSAPKSTSRPSSPSPSSSAAEFETPTLGAWKKIQSNPPPGWKDIAGPGRPLIIPNFSGMRDFEFKFDKQKWYDVTDPSNELEVTQPKSIAKLNAEYMRRTTDSASTASTGTTSTTSTILGSDGKPIVAESSKRTITKSGITREMSRSIDRRSLKQKK